MFAARPDGIIVSRHPATVDFIRHDCPGATSFPIVAEATKEDVEGQHVFGNIPLHLCVLADKVTAIEYDSEPPRDTEYTFEEMKKSAWLRTYYVYNVRPRQV